MTHEINLYDGYYGHLATDPQVEVRRETYGEDLGQASWITASEARRWFDLLHLSRGQTALEVACGSGGVTCAMANHTGATCVGVDINAHGIEAAKNRAERDGISSLVAFQVIDAGSRLPFRAESFDAVFSNDSINHLPGRSAVLHDWYRLLRPGGRVLFTDPIVVTGQLSNEEIRTRSSIGFFLFTPWRSFRGKKEKQMTKSERILFDKLQTEPQREAFLLCRSFARLKKEFPLSQSSLADRVGVTQQGAGYVIAKLFSVGAIEKTADAKTNRKPAFYKWNPCPGTTDLPTPRQERVPEPTSLGR